MVTDDGAVVDGALVVELEDGATEEVVEDGATVVVVDVVVVVVVVDVVVVVVVVDVVVDVVVVDPAAMLPVPKIFPPEPYVAAKAFVPSLDRSSDDHAPARF